MNDIRWVQRFDSFTRALRVLSEGVDLAGKRELSELERQGLIQGFEYTHELAWNMLRDYLTHQGIFGLIGSRDAVRAAFRNGLIEDGEAWMKMIETRNLTSHTYNSETASSVMKDIVTQFHPAFERLHRTFNRLVEEMEQDS